MSNLYPEANFHTNYFMQNCQVADMFLELGSEEIPAGYVEPALNYLKTELLLFLDKNQLKHGSAVVMGSPRRLTVAFSGIAVCQSDSEEVFLGPSVQAAYDGEGKPTRAAIGFAKGKGIDPADLTVQDTEKGQVVCARVQKTGQPAEVLLKDFLPQLIEKIPFPKKMRWADQPTPFVRPLHWIVALFEEKVLPFEVCGTRTGNLSRGHRFYQPAEFAVSGLTSYLESCEKNFVVIDPEERRSRIWQETLALAKGVGGSVEEDSALLSEVAFLVEYPVPVLGNFDEKYLKLPKELLSIVMKRHQRYFPVVDANGKLLSHFITISNMKQGEGEEIRKGNQRVLKARLEDARFFFEEDRKKKLQDFNEDLKGVTFQKKLGTSHEKLLRIIALAGAIADKVCPDQKISAVRSAELCKADLCSQMVFEFPELQGIAGGYYADHSGEAPAIGQAIKEHYKPAFSGDEPPLSQAGAVVAIADKLDTILGCISVGLIPSGSEDPYALRRNALGIIQIILHHRWDISLADWIDLGLKSLEDKMKSSKDEIQLQVSDLFQQRFRTLLKEKGYSYDAVNAVLAVGIDSPLDVMEKVAAFSELKEKPYFEALAIAFRRVVSILKDPIKGEVDPALFEVPAEKDLYKVYMDIKEPVRKLAEKKQFSQALEKIAEIKPEVDAFFDGVMVMAKEENLKNNRLRLLQGIAGLFSDLADFSKIEIKKG